MSGRRAMVFLATVRLALALSFLLLGVQAWRVLVRDAPPFHADEAGHALPAARMAIALGRADLPGFASASLRELVWPFLHPWVVSGFFLAFGVSAEVARVSSLLAFGAVLAALPGFARALATPADRAGPAGPLLGWLSAAILAAAAPWYVVTTVMGEPLGMLLTLLALWAAARAVSEPGLGPSVAFGLLAAAAFFTKYSYGLPLMAAGFVALAAKAPARGPRQLAAAVASAAAPITIWAAAMFGPEPGRLRELRDILVNRDEGLRGLANSLFYARALSEVVGTALALAVVLLLVAAALRRPEARRLPALVFVATTLLLLTLHPNKQQRYLFPVLPVMLVLAELEAARHLRRAWTLAIWPALAGAAIVAGDPLGRIDVEARDAVRLGGARAIVEFVADGVPADAPVLVLGSTGLLTHYAITWALLERAQREPEVDVLQFPGEQGWDARYRAGYPTEMRQEYTDLLGQALASGRFRAVVTLDLDERSPFRPDWLAKWDAWGQNYVRAMDAAAGASGYALQAERAFPADHARVRLFFAPEPR